MIYIEPVEWRLWQLSRKQDNLFQGDWNLDPCGYPLSKQQLHLKEPEIDRDHRILVNDFGE